MNVTAKRQYQRIQKKEFVKGATLKVYPGAPHGMCSTLKDEVNADLLAFIGAYRSASA